MSSHEVNQIFVIFSPSTESTGGSADGNVSRSVQTALVRSDVKSSAASGGPLAGLSDAQRCSNYFQVSNLTTCRRNNNHKSEIWARNQISFSQQDSDDQTGVPVTERGVNMKMMCKKKI